MWHRLIFSIRHSLNDLWVNRQRTFFALLCIAAGVAAIVALQLLGLMIRDTLAENFQQRNRGDIRLSLPTPGENRPDELVAQGIDAGILTMESTGFGYQAFSISVAGMDQLRLWLDQRFPGQVEAITYRQQVIRPDRLRLYAPDHAREAHGVTPFVIERAVYPLYGNIVTVDGTPINTLLTAPNEIVINQELADKLNMSVGGQVQMTGIDTNIVVKGIVPDGTADATNPGLAQAGYFFMDTSGAQLFNTPPSANEIYLRLSDPRQTVTIDQSLEAAFPFLMSESTADLEARDVRSGNMISLSATLMGLLALLIGSIGIINTMNVIVRRRMLEVAVLKTVGLQGRQVMMLFMVQAFIMGIIGSFVGVVLGVVLSYVAKDLAAGLTISTQISNTTTVAAQTMPFRLSGMPIAMGFLTGVIVTTIFGFVPVLVVGQVRPALVLRPTETGRLKVGAKQSFPVFLVLVLVVGLVAGTIVNNLVLGMVVVIIAFLVAGLIYGLLILLITIISRFFPTLGNTNLYLSLRAMSAARGRAALTVLALAVGTFAISLILLVVGTTLTMLQASAAQDVGGNIFALAGGPLGQQQIVRAVNETPGVTGHSIYTEYQASLRHLESSTGTFTLDDLKARVEATDGVGAVLQLGDTLARPGGVELTARALNQQIVAGRQLNTEDAGRPVVVMPTLANVNALPYNIGDKITFTFGGEGGPERTYEIVGIYQMKSVAIGAGANTPYMPIDSFPDDVAAITNGVAITVDKAQVSELRTRLDRVPGVFILSINEFMQEFEQLFRQYSAFPIVVGLISLLVGSIVIANSVALSTMERRREIAVMKAVGVQRSKVLGMLLMENGILGTIGGLVGVGLALLGLLATVSMSGLASTQSTVSIPYGTALGLLMLCLVLSLMATIFTAWGASGEKPLQVLRYE